MSNTLEGLVKEVGDCGCYQFLLVPLALACVPTAVWSMLHMVFGAVEPDWWCVPRDRLRNKSRDHFLNSSVGGNYGSWAGGADVDVSTAVWNDGGDLDESDMAVLLDNASFKTCGADLGQNGGCERIVFASGMNTVVSQVC